MRHPDRVFKQSIISNNFPRRNTVKKTHYFGGGEICMSGAVKFTISESYSTKNAPHIYCLNSCISMDKPANRIFQLLLKINSVCC